MDCRTNDQAVTVHLSGGPWDRFEIAGVYDHEEIYEVPREELGAHMPTPGDPDAIRRALYEPREDRTVWHFVGWR